MRQEKLSQKVFNATEGIFAYAVDLGLWLTVYFAQAAMPQSRTGALSRSQWSADKFLEKWNYYTLKNAINAAQKVGLVRRSGKGRRTKPEITSAGRKRLEAMLPRYDDKRHWDGRLYLLTYDVPEERKRDRELIRSIAKRLGMGMLQKSVWITPYDPRETLRELANEQRLSGSIIVSDIGKDGSIGEENIEDLLVRVYKLDELNDRYSEFICDCQKAERDTIQLYFTYLSILHDDPQLPFKLLPDWWRGDEAYQLFHQEIAKKRLSPKKFI